MDLPLLARASRALSHRDPRLGAWIRRVGPCGLRQRGDPYSALVHAVVHQQLAGAAAAAIGRRVRVSGGAIPAPGGAPCIARGGAAFRRALPQKSGDTARSRRGVSEWAHHHAPLVPLNDAQVVERLTEIKGIGEWTAHMLLIFSLGRVDVLPLGDYGIRKGAQRLYALRELPRGRELERIGEPWRPYRSVASWYLWQIAQATGED